MPQYWLEILDVLEERNHSSSVHPATTPSPLTTLMAFMYLAGKFTSSQLHISCYMWFYLITIVSCNQCKFIFPMKFDFIISETQFTLYFQRPSSQCYLSGKHHLSAWVQLWRSSSCWWREGEWGQSGDLCGGVLGNCVRQWIWERRGNGCVQAIGHEVSRYNFTGCAVGEL